MSSLLKIVLAGGVLALLIGGGLKMVGDRAEKNSDPKRAEGVTIRARLVSPSPTRRDIQTARKDPSEPVVLPGKQDR